MKKYLPTSDFGDKTNPEREQGQKVDSPYAPLALDKLKDIRYPNFHAPDV